LCDGSPFGLQFLRTFGVAFKGRIGQNRAAMNAAQIATFFHLTQVAPDRIKGCVKKGGQIVDMNCALASQKFVDLVLAA
jgi:Pyruvate/2-oxoacid:ferredoxin oxidoreductase gamma subunit